MWEEYIISYFLNIIEHRGALSPSSPPQEYFSRLYAVHILEKAALGLPRRFHKRLERVNLMYHLQVPRYLGKHYSACFYDSVYG